MFTKRMAGSRRVILIGVKRDSRMMSWKEMCDCESSVAVR